MLLHLRDDVDRFAARAIRVDAQRVVDLRQVSRIELDIQNRTNHLNDLAHLRVLHDL
jgi:hypothetical protein